MPEHLTRTDLQYDLPPERIARTPVRPRDHARMLVFHREGGRVEHRRVSDIGSYLEPGDLLCMNDSAVLPARLSGTRVDSGGRVDGIVLDASGDRLTAMLRSNGTLRPGLELDLVGPNGALGRVRLIDRDGARWCLEPVGAFTLDQIGHTPLPPYILKARSNDGHDELDADDRRWYRTVYEDESARGSVAAPTAGFHFTPELLGQLSEQGVDQAMVTLHVGAGTFAPIGTELVHEHPMHEEAWSIGPEALAALATRRGDAAAGRIVAVGTTTVRVLESLPSPFPGPEVGQEGRTDLLIAPGWDFRHTDAILTNFHLPESTLLALVGAFMGLDLLKKVYQEAVESGYRFYSYGDAMLIL